MTGYKLIGKLKSGESIYVSDGGEYAVEREHSYLVEPTPEEKNECQIIHVSL